MITGELLKTQAAAVLNKINEGPELYRTALCLSLVV